MHLKDPLGSFEKSRGISQLPILAEILITRHLSRPTAVMSKRRSLNLHILIKKDSFNGRLDIFSLSLILFFSRCCVDWGSECISSSTIVHVSTGCLDIGPFDKDTFHSISSAIFKSAFYTFSGLLPDPYIFINKISRPCIVFKKF
jgi:hypothetical protein